MLNVGDIVALYDSVDNNLLHKYVIVEENITLDIISAISNN